MTGKSDTRHGKKRGAERVRPRYFFLFLTISLAVLSAGGYQAWLERERRASDLLLQEQASVRAHEERIAREISSSADALLRASRNSNLRRATALGATVDVASLEASFATLLADDRAGGEILLLDADGHERLRVEPGEGQLIYRQPDSLTAAAELPALPAGIGKRGVHLWHPKEDDSAGGKAYSIRLGAPVYDSEGLRRGTLLLTRSLRHLIANDPSGGERELRLAGPGEAERLPGPEGQLDDLSGLYTYRSIDLPLALAPKGQDARGAKGESARSWKLVSFLPRSELRAELNAFLYHMLPPYLALLVALAWAASLLARADLRRRRAMVTLEESREERQALLARVSDLVFTLDLDWNDLAGSRLLMVNKAGFHLTGHTPEEFTQLTLGEFLVPESLPKMKALGEGLLAGKPMESPCEIKALTRDGRCLTLSAVLSILHADKETVSFQVVAQDISELKSSTGRVTAMEEALVLQSAVSEALEILEPLEVRLEAVLEQLMEYIDLRDPGLAAVYRHDEEEQHLVLLAARGQGSEELFQSGSEPALAESELCSVAISSGCLQFSPHCGPGEQALHPGLKIGDHGHCIIPLRAAGKIMGVLLLFTPPDLNWLGHRRESLEQLGLRIGGTLWREEVMDALGSQAKVLQKSLTRAEEEVAAKSRFLKDMGGKLNTPVEGIISLVELALESERREEQRERLEAVKRAAQSLLKIIGNVLDLAQIESGNFDFTECEFHLRETLRDALNAVAWQAEAKGLSIRAEVEKNIPATLLGDPNRLNQVLINLLGNAVKFTESGEIVVKVEVARIEPAVAMLHFSVQDTGIGIADDKQQEIFEAFSQADHGVASQPGGTGLGLTLSAMLVKYMGGRIWVQSAARQGSTFHFTSQFRLNSREETRRLSPVSEAEAGQSEQERAEKPQKAEKPEKAGPSLQILHAEDNEEKQKQAVELLQSAGHRVKAVSTGIKAIEAIAQEDFDLVLMDIQMSDMDGLITTRAIREFEKTAGGHIIIVGMAVHVTESDRDRCLTAGMDGCLTKPVKMQELSQYTDQLAQARQVNPAGKTGEKEDVPMDISIFDKASALDRMGGDLDLLTELARMFIADYPRMLSEIETALTEGNSDAVQRSAHTLKGAVGNFSAKGTFDAAFELENIGRSGELDKAPPALTALREEIDKLDPMLSDL